MKESGERLISKEEYHVFSDQLCVCVLWDQHLPYSGECDINRKLEGKSLEFAKKKAREQALRKLEHYSGALLKEVGECS